MDHLTDTQKNYQSLLESGHLSDVTVTVGGKEFQLHKAILAASSPVFLAMFISNCTEAAESRLTIDDITVDVFEALIRYIYGGVAPNLAAHAMELFVVADKYQLEALKRSCSIFLASQMTIEASVEILLLADMHSDAELKKKALCFIVKNAKDVRATVGWQRFKDAKRVDLMDQLMEGLLDSQPKKITAESVREFILSETRKYKYRNTRHFN